MKICDVSSPKIEQVEKTAQVLDQTPDFLL